MRKRKIKKITSAAMFCAAAYVMMCLSKLIPVNIGGFLSMDFKDIAIVICGFVLGPASVLTVTGIAAFFEMITVSTNGFVGFAMNILSTAAFAIPSTLVYIKTKVPGRSLWGLLIGTACMTVTMLFWNLLITPAYLGVEREAVEGMLLTVFLPFNLIKGALNSVGVLLVYKPVLRVQGVK